MKFSVKSAGQYSNTLSDMIAQLSFREYNADNEGLVKVVETAQKSKIVTGKAELTFTDEEKEIKPVDRASQVDPMKRLEIIKDLVEEKNKIDYVINEQKRNLTIISPFSDKEINVDLATKENSLIRHALMGNYTRLFGIDDEEKEYTRKMNLMVDNQVMTFEYPVIVKKTSLVDENKVNAEYEDIYVKSQKSSDLIDKALSSTSFDFDTKFPLYSNIDKVIKMYQN